MDPSPDNKDYVLTQFAKDLERELRAAEAKAGKATELLEILRNEVDEVLPLRKARTADLMDKVTAFLDAAKEGA